MICLKNYYMFNLLLNIAISTALISSCNGKGKHSQSSMVSDKVNTIIKMDTVYALSENTSLIVVVSLEQLINDYGEKQVIEAIYSIDSLRPILKLEQEVDWMNLSYGLKELNEKDTKKIINNLENYINSLEKSERLKALKRLYYYCQANILLDIPYEYWKDMEFAQIIYEIKETRFLVEKHLVTKEQYWGSLSSYQISQLGYEVPAFLSSLSSEQQLAFFGKYFRIIKKMRTDN